MTPCVLVGAGERACRVLLPALADAGFEVSTVVDNDTATYERFIEACERNSLRLPNRFTSAMPSSLSESWAVVATPHSTHASIALALLSMVDYVLKEKPLAASLEDALRLSPFQHRIHVMVDRPYSEDFRWIAAQIRHIGPVEFYEATYLREPSDYRDTWRNDVQLAGGGVVIDMGYHMLDMSVHLFGPVCDVSWSRPGRCHARVGYQVEERADLLIHHDSGVVGRIRLSRVANEDAERHSFVSKQGTIEIGTRFATASSGTYRSSIALRRDSIYRVSQSIRYARKRLEGVTTPLQIFDQDDAAHGLHVMEVIAKLYSCMPTGGFDLE